MIMGGVWSGVLGELHPFPPSPSFPFPPPSPPQASSSFPLPSLFLKVGPLKSSSGFGGAL